MIYNYWITDSDVTDVPVAFLSQKRQYELLSNYSKNFEYVIQTLQKRNKWVAVASPCGVLMESKFFGPPTSSRFHDKENALNRYTKATEMVTIKTGVPYIDIRTPSLAAIPQYRVAYKGMTFIPYFHSDFWCWSWGWSWSLYLSYVSNNLLCRCTVLHFNPIINSNRINNCLAIFTLLKLKSRSLTHPNINPLPSPLHTPFDPRTLFLTLYDSCIKNKVLR